MNNGNARDFPVLRCRKTKAVTFETAAYPVYGPKVIAIRHSIDDPALESRCITSDLHSVEENCSVPTELPEGVNQELDKLRNVLLSFRLSYSRRENYVKNLEVRLSARIEQIYLPLLTLITSENERREVISYAHVQLSQMIRGRGMGVIADCTPSALYLLLERVKISNNWAYCFTVWKGV